jgi:NitT/TauT family transport system substrate-binding protein
VRVGSIAAINDAGLYLALERGYFAAERLDVDLIPFRASAEMIPLLGNGQLEVGSGAAIPSIFNAIARGVPLRIVGDKGSYLGSCALALIVRREIAEQVRGVEDLAGRKVAVVNLNVATHVDLVKALDAAGLAPSQIEPVAIPFPDMNAALANGAVDAAMQTEPFITLGVEQGIATPVECGEELNPGRQYAMLVYAPHFSEGSRNAGERLMVAYLRGVRDYTDAMRGGADKEAVLDVLVRYAPMDREVYRRMRPVDLDPDGRPNRASIAFDQATLLRLGAVSQPVDLDAVVDSSFAEHAMSRLGPYRGPLPGAR